MNLASKIKVNSRYSRSINLERDADSESILESYIPTSRALSTLERIGNTFSSKECPRSWSLVGPYGAGKSSFGLFLNQLLGGRQDARTKAAFSKLKKYSAELHKKYSSINKGDNSYLRVVITGSPKPLVPSFISHLHEAAENFWFDRRGRKPVVISKLKKASEDPSTSVDDALTLLQQLQADLGKADCKGIVLIFDELGKFLEYDARHYGANNVYVLQSLAEHAFSGGDVTLHLIVLLHQSIEQYAAGLSENIKNEWIKIQGRFESLPFVETQEQTLRVLAEGVEQVFSKKEENAIKKEIEKTISPMFDEGVFGQLLKRRDAIDLFYQCFPLHPISAWLLPSLCNKIAQNERTLFSYLASSEPSGFKDRINTFTSIEEWIYPADLYDYFIQNYPLSISDNVTRKRWVEAMSALERLGDAPSNQINLIKTIGLFNMIGARGSFKASKPLLQNCIPSTSNIKKDLDELSKKSIVNYRKFSGEYRIWEGTDFDFDAALDEERSALIDVDISQVLNSTLARVPIVARKYSIKHGTLRYVRPTFLNTSSFKAAAKKSDATRLLFFIATSDTDREIFHKQFVPLFSRDDICVLCENGVQLSNAVLDIVALDHVHQKRKELQSDPVAMRELEERISCAHQQLNRLSEDLLRQPEEHVWVWNKDELQIHSRRQLQEVLSDIFEKIYSKAPNIRNESINRDKPSTPIISARNKLLMLMVEKQDQENLGIEKFPPEKAMYLSLLKDSGLHRKLHGEYKFTNPPPKDKNHWLPVWEKIDAFIDGTEKKAKSFVELDDLLTSTPYGVKKAILPVIYTTAYLANEDEIALYENGKYAPYLGAEHIERFIRRPQSFQIQSYRVKGIKSGLIKEYSKVLFSDEKSKMSVLAVAKPLVSFMDGLPDYTKKTKTISEQSIRLRAAFQIAKSPESLLFDEIPKALGTDDNRVDKAHFANAFRESLKELKYAYENMISSQTTNIASAFEIPKNSNLKEMRKRMARLNGLENYTVDREGLRAFITRATITDTEDTKWLESLLSFLGQKPTTKWADTEVSTAEFRLSEFSRRLNDLEKIRVTHEGKDKKRSGDFDVLLLKLVRQGREEHEKIVCVDEKIKSACGDVTKSILKSLDALKDNELKAAALAQAVDEYMNENQLQSKDDAKISKMVSKLKN